MDFGSLLSFAQKNEKSSASSNYYKARFDAPKKEHKPNANLSSNIQKFLAQKEEEERRRSQMLDEKRRTLLAMRDPKDKRKIEKMLKVIKSANKSVLSDTLEDETAITVSGPSQPDEDDYGYESQVAADLYQKIMNKYSKMPVEEKFSSSGKGTVKDLSNTKDRVRAAIEREREIENDPHLRRLKRKEARMAQNEDGTAEDSHKDEPEEEIFHSTKEEKKKRPPAPPPLDFHELLRLAEQKRLEPVALPGSKEFDKKRNDEPVPPRPMTSKERRAWLEEQERLKRRAERDQQEKQGKKYGHKPITTAKPPLSIPNKPDNSKQTDSPKPFSIPKIPKKRDVENRPMTKPTEKTEQVVRVSEKYASEQVMRKPSDKRPDHTSGSSERIRSNKDTLPDKYHTDRTKTESTKTPSSKMSNNHRSSNEKIKDSEKTKSLFDSPKSSSHMPSQKESSRSKEPQKSHKSHPIPSHMSHPIPSHKSHSVPSHKSHSIPSQKPQPTPSHKSHPNPSDKSHPIPSDRSHPIPSRKPHPIPSHKSQSIPPLKSHNSEEKVREKHKDLFGRESSSNNSLKSKQDIRPEIKHNNRTDNRHIPISTKHTNGLQPRDHGSNKSNTNNVAKPNVSKLDSRDKFEKPTTLKNAQVTKTNNSAQKRPEYQQGTSKPMINKPNEQSMQKRPELKQESSRNMMNKPFKGQQLQKQPEPQRGTNKPVMNKPANGQRPMPPAPPVRQFPPMDMKDTKKIKKPIKRRIDSESEEDSEMENFIDDDDDGDDYSSYIKEIFGYDKSKYHNIDEDDSNMESNFAQVMREEFISKKIGLMEDLEDMRMEAEEKKLKAMKKKMKK